MATFSTPLRGQQELTLLGSEKTTSSLVVFIGALAANKPLVLPGVNKKTLVYVIKTSVLQWCWFGDRITQK